MSQRTRRNYGIPVALVVTLTVLAAHSLAGWLSMVLAIGAAAVAFGMLAGSAFDLFEASPRTVPSRTDRQGPSVGRAA